MLLRVLGGVNDIAVVVVLVNNQQLPQCIR